jgi:hypothetical protein
MIQKQLLLLHQIRMITVNFPKQILTSAQYAREIHPFYLFYTKGGPIMDARNEKHTK